MALDDNNDARWPSGDARILIQRAAVLWAQARDATSSEARVEFERLALLYERLTVRAARREPHRSTLGDLLYADKAKPRVTESDWVALVQMVARGDLHALQTLYVWTHRLVLTLIMRITNDWFDAKELTADVFHDLWRAAEKFDSLHDSVIGWILNLARSRALGHLRADAHADAHADGLADEHVDEHIDHASATASFLEMVVDWPSDVPPSFSAPLWKRIAERIAVEGNAPPLLLADAVEHAPPWEQLAPGIFCKLLATDAQRGRVSMLVRLAPRVEYPPHIHAGVEELHLLQGELRVDDTTFHPGDYNRAEPGTADKRVWSETGCTCVLITSSRDIIG